jgi:hypothetical protein
MSHDAWIQQAESDLEAAKVLSHSAFHSQAVWLAAQAVEKAHKAILAALGLRYEDKHFKRLGHGTGEIADLLPVTLHEPIVFRVHADAPRRAGLRRGPAGADAAEGAPRLRGHRAGEAGGRRARGRKP